MCLSHPPHPHYSNSSIMWRLYVKRFFLNYVPNTFSGKALQRLKGEHVENFIIYGVSYIKRAFAYTLKGCKGDFMFIYQIKCQPEYHFEIEVTQCHEQAPGISVKRESCSLMSSILSACLSPPL